MSETSTDLVTLPSGELVALKDTGEMVGPDDPAACALALEQARDLERAVRDLKNSLIDMIEEGVTTAGQGRTLHLPGVTVISKKNVDILWDAQQLETDLREAGMSEERIREIVVEEVSYTVRAAEAKKAASVNPEYAQAVEAARTEIEKRPSVQVKR